MVSHTTIKSCYDKEKPGGEIEIEKIPSSAQKEGHIPILQLNTRKRIHGSRYSLISSVCKLFVSMNLSIYITSCVVY